MVSSKETTPSAYLASLPAEHRAAISTVRALVNKHLPRGFVETMNWGMICWEVPLSRYPETYNKAPLMFIGLASQKNNYALYLTNLHDPEGAHARLAAAYKAAGRRFDMGKSCLRFKSVDELPQAVIGEIIAETTVDRLIARYERSRTAFAAKKTTKGASKPAQAAKPKTKAATTATTRKSATKASATSTRAVKPAGAAKKATSASPAKAAKTSKAPAKAPARKRSV